MGLSQLVLLPIMMIPTYIWLQKWLWYRKTSKDNKLISRKTTSGNWTRYLRRKFCHRTSVHLNDAVESKCMFAAISIPYVVILFPRVARISTVKFISNSKKINMSANRGIVSMVSNEGEKYKSCWAGFVVFSGSYLLSF